MTTTLIVHKNADGFTVSTHKTQGLNKGFTTLATFCGGSFGRILTIQCVTTAWRHLYADDVILENHLESYAKYVHGFQSVIDAISTSPVSSPMAN